MPASPTILHNCQLCTCRACTQVNRIKCRHGRSVESTLSGTPSNELIMQNGICVLEDCVLKTFNAMGVVKTIGDRKSIQYAANVPAEVYYVMVITSLQACNSTGPLIRSFVGFHEGERSIGLIVSFFIKVADQFRYDRNSCK